MVKINFDKLLKSFMSKFLKAIEIDYGVGSAFTLTTAKSDGKQTNMNPLSLNKKEQKANTEMIGKLVKDVNDEMAKKISYLVNKSVTDKWSNKQLEKELKGIFEKDNPNYFNYKNRFKTIARTETTRIMNNSAYNTAKRLKFTHKYISIVNDNRTSEQSKLFFSKYGREDKSIRIDEEFFIIYKGKRYNGLLPPFMPNDRDFVIFTDK